MEDKSLEYNLTICEECGTKYNLDKNYEGGWSDKNGISHEEYKCPNCGHIFEFSFNPIL